MPILKGVALLKALLEESNLQPKDLVSICESESTVLDILNGNCKLTENQIQNLANFFRIPPTYLVE
ncbi:transcriptional regulator [Cylindrospermum stagnale]|uniref:transcriptional regulator n=1 Tax=Cylindrospermum stagnale TaxID=142864 RepID=UPI0002EF73AF|nr:transcriptional regulator [Cylindrospermum stagnale]